MRKGIFRIGLLFNLFACCALAAPPPCPAFQEAEIRIQARVEFLTKQIDGLVQRAGPPKTLTVSSKTPDLAIALASVIAARAREEARIWLVDQIADGICNLHMPEVNGYFPSTCAAVPSNGAYPGPSLTLLSTELRKDVYALPACYTFRNFQRQGGANADAIDPYVFQAGLVAAYVSHTDGTLDPKVPTLEKDVPDEDIAKILVLSLIANIGFESWPVDGSTPVTCPAKTITCLFEAIGRVEQFLDDQAPPERIVSFLRQQLAVWDHATHKHLSLLSSAYLSAASGNYVEAALSTASMLECKSNSDISKLCARLPLLGEVASASSREEMEAALDRVISPVGAWKRKQAESVWSLNAMAGLAFGAETLKENSASTTETTMGLYMPIGIEYSWPVELGPWIRSVALGATVLDLGGIVSYSTEGELAGGETSSSANTSWSSLTSPGLYFAVAFKNSPFRAGLSASRTPDLRSIDFGNGVEKAVDSTRYMFFVTVDVTLLGF